jgi:hypothetical protein
MEYHPRTNVSFAPTEPFCRRWGNEAQEQMRKFKISTWQQDTETPEPPAPPPVPQDEPLLSQDEENAAPFYAMAALAALFLVGISIGAYVAYKCQAK